MSERERVRRLLESAIMNARAVISAMKTGVAGCVAGGSGYETRRVDRPGYRDESGGRGKGRLGYYWCGTTEEV